MVDKDIIPPVIFLMGPTATGKTSLAVELHKILPVEIISVDSAMVYRGLNIGTAKPNSDVLEQAPHRLIDICDPIEAYSAGRFYEDARVEIEEIYARSKIPLLVGGTGLYFRSLQQGISNLPSADTKIRAKLDQEAVKIGWQAMHDRLSQVDKDSAKRIHPNDSQRIQRALEVFEITGTALSVLNSNSCHKPLAYKLKKIILMPKQRAITHGLISARFMQMIELGLIDEVKFYFERGDLDASTPSMRLVGYRQVWRYLEGLLDYDQMLDKAIVATRQLAKRQMTWFKSEQDGTWFDPSAPNLIDKILKYLLEDPNIIPRV